MRWPLQTARSRRRQAMASAFPAHWRRWLADAWPTWHELERRERRHLEDLTQGFLATIEIEPAHGTEVDERMSVLIAAQAGLLVLGHSLRDGPGEALRRLADVRTVVVHPTTVVLAGERPTGTPKVVTDAPMHLLGQAELYGPVLLAWDAVERGLAGGRGDNVVLHEFAHKLDMADGAIDGTPMVEDREVAQRWQRIATAELASLRRGHDPVLRQYGAKNPAEFFAVATEAFFGRPTELAEFKPDLYAVMCELYLQDPAGRTARQLG